MQRMSAVPLGLAACSQSCASRRAARNEQDMGRWRCLPGWPLLGMGPPPHRHSGEELISPHAFLLGTRAVAAPSEGGEVADSRAGSQPVLFEMVLASDPQAPPWASVSAPGWRLRVVSGGVPAPRRWYCSSQTHGSDCTRTLFTPLRVAASLLSLAAGTDSSLIGWMCPSQIRMWKCQFLAACDLIWKQCRCWYNSLRQGSLGGPSTSLTVCYCEGNIWTQGHAQKQKVGEDEGRDRADACTSQGRAVIAHEARSCGTGMECICSHRPQGEPILLIPQFRTSSLQNCETRTFCHLSHSVRGVLLRQP